MLRQPPFTVRKVPMVVLITTKRGKAVRLSLLYDGMFAVHTKRLDMMNLREACHFIITMIWQHG